MDAVRQLCQGWVSENRPDAPLLLEALAGGYLRAFRLGDVDVCLREWLARVPDAPGALFLRAQLYERADRRDEAVEAYRDLLARDPAFDGARQMLTELLVQLNRGQEALPDVEALRRRHPDDLDVQVRLARCLDQAARQDEARAVLDGVLARDPRFALAAAERGRMALEEGDLAEAEALLRRARDLEPANYQARHQFFQCLRQAGKTEEARQEQQVLKQLDHDYKRLHEISTHDMQKRPHDAALHFEMATIMRRAGAIAESVRWLHSTLREDPRHVEAHRALAGYYRTVGNAALAAQHEKQAGSVPLAP
jgi:predicted Zn-dependent protease